MEKENTELEAEGRRLKKKLDTLKNMAFQLEALEKENSQLEEENLQLRRSAESLRSAGAKAAQLEAENRELESERSQLKRSLELLKASSKKTERLEVRFQDCQSYGFGEQRDVAKMQPCVAISFLWEIESRRHKIMAPCPLDLCNLSQTNILTGMLQGIWHIMASGSSTTSSRMLLIS